MSLRLLNKRKLLKIDTNSDLSINTSNSSIQQPKSTSSNLLRKMSQTRTSNVLNDSSSSPCLSHIPHHHSPFNSSPDSRQSKYYSQSSLPRIVTNNNSRPDLDTSSNHLQKSELAGINKKKFLPFGMFTTPEKIKEECEARFRFTRKSVGELSMMKILNNVHSHTHKEIIDDTTKAIKNAEQVLGTMGIKVKSYKFLTSDSIMSIYPVTEQYRLANFYKMFIPEMCRFNYVFLSNLRIGAITVCESVMLTSTNHAAILNQKLHNGLFILQKMSNKKKVQKHWFRIIIYHFLKVEPDFYAEWKDMISNGSQKNIKSPLNELVKTLRRLVGAKKDNWKENSELRRRAKVLDEALRELNFLSTETTEEDE